MEHIRARTHEGESFGHITEVAPHIWRWPFRHMQHGDWFTVSAQQRSIGTVRGAAQQAGYRMNKRFSVTGDGETITVVCEPPLEEGGRTPAEIAADKATLVGGDGDKYLGTLVPPERGQWAWPFGKMEPGQYFHVSHTDRHPERVRQTVMVRASQLGIKLSVRARDHEKPHHCRIEYVDTTQSDDTHRDLDYEATNAILERCYGVDFNSLDQVWMLDAKPWESMEFMQPRLAAPRVDAFVMKLSYVSMAIQLKEDRIIVTGLPKNTGYMQWLEHEALS